MDFLPYIGTIISFITTCIALYVGIVSRLTKTETIIEENQKLTQSQINDLKKQVEKHNSVVERTYKMESDLNTAFKRIDELREKDARIEDKIDKITIGFNS